MPNLLFEPLDSGATLDDITVVDTQTCFFSSDPRKTDSRGMGRPLFRESTSTQGTFACAQFPHAGRLPSHCPLKSVTLGIHSYLGIPENVP